MFTSKKAAAKGKRKKRGSKTRSKQMLDLTWQFIGMITIIVILMTLAFGESYQATSFAKDNFLDKSFSDVVSNFEVTLFGN